nr:immunoglobulin light chain junction region [Macaca mulatta]MOV62557.1 immunoglobulin light chain junction region [Macaca mulatta]
CQQGYSYPVTF